VVLAGGAAYVTCRAGYPGWAPAVVVMVIIAVLWVVRGLWLFGLLHA